MYYYGGYQGYGQGYPNTGGGYGAAVILVLFILLVIIIGSRTCNMGCNHNCQNCGN